MAGSHTISLSFYEYAVVILRIHSKKFPFNLYKDRDPSSSPETSRKEATFRPRTESFIV